MSLFKKPDVHKVVVDSVWMACIHLNLADRVTDYLQNFLWRILSSSADLKLLSDERFSDLITMASMLNIAGSAAQQYDLALRAGEVALFRNSILIAPGILPPVDPLLRSIGQYAYAIASRTARKANERKSNAFMLRDVSDAFPECIDGLRMAQQDLARIDL